MTLPAQTRRSPVYFGNGVTTTFPFTFKVYTSGDIDVIKSTSGGAETTLTLNVDYTVNINADQNSAPGGSVVLTPALPTGEKMVIVGALDNAQTTNLSNFGFYPESVEDMGDKIVMLIQQLSDAVGRSLSRADTDPNATLSLPAPTANKLLGWSSDGTVLENKDFLAGVLVSAFMEGVLASSDASAARTALGTIGALYTSASGGDFMVFTSTATAAESGLRLDQTQSSSGMSLRISNSGLNVQTSLRGRGDGGATIYVGQTAGAASTSGLQAFDVNPDGNVVVGNSGVNNGRIITVYNPNAGSSAYARLTVQSDAGQAHFQASSIAGGRGTFLYSNTGGTFSIYTQGANILELGTNSTPGRLSFGASGGITSNEDMTFAAGKVPKAKNTAKAWVNFAGDGTGATATIRNSYNVSSVTDHGIGDFTVNFATAMASANYAFAGSAGNGTGVLNSIFVAGPTFAAPTTSAFRFTVCDLGGSTVNSVYVNAIFYGE